MNDTGPREALLRAYERAESDGGGESGAAGGRPMTTTEPTATAPTIPTEAVEAAARAMYSFVEGGSLERSGHAGDYYRDEARLALEAALPFLQGSTNLHQDLAVGVTDEAVESAITAFGTSHGGWKLQMRNALEAALPFLDGASPRVDGYCPMGCGQTLALNVEAGAITCLSPDCPSPVAVDALLEDPETEHVVLLGEEGFSVQHPLQERLYGALFQCGLHRWLTRLDWPPRAPGRYRVTWNADDPASTGWAAVGERDG